jgi:hypothetical protein
MLPTSPTTCATLVLFAAALASTPSLAGNKYQEALAACRKNALAAQDSADFKCKWKTIVRGAPGGALTGKYRYRANGLTGTLTVLEGDGPILVGVSTVRQDKSQNQCSVDLQGARDANDELLVKPTGNDDSGCEVRIKSIPGPNLISVTVNDKCSGFCGNRAAFDGEYQLRK